MAPGMPVEREYETVVTNYSKPDTTVYVDTSAAYKGSVAGADSTTDSAVQGL